MHISFKIFRLTPFVPSLYQVVKMKSNFDWFFRLWEVINLKTTIEQGQWKFPEEYNDDDDDDDNNIIIIIIIINNNILIILTLTVH